MRTPLPLLGTVALALSLACGGSEPAPAPTPPGPTGDEGSGPDGGTPPAETARPPDDVGPPAEQRFVTVERIDDHPECDALVPRRIAEPVTARLENPGGECRRAVSDGAGHVAVEIGLPSPCGERQVLSPDGRPAARFTDCHAIAPQPDGWLLPWGTYGHGPGSVRLLSFLGDGAVRGTVSFDAVSSPLIAGRWPFGGDPRGGAFLVVSPFRSSPDAPCAGTGHRFDASGAPTGAPASVGCSVRAAAVSTSGDALAIERGVAGPLSGRSIVHWVRPDGTDAAPPSDEGDSTALLGQWDVDLAPLLDGAIAARTGGGWTRRYPRAAASGEPAPAWLAARNGESFRFTRGNRGYAFLPHPGQASAGCRQSIDLLAPGGRLCVRLTFREEGTGCTTGAIDQGWDGTVVQQSGRDACTYRWWPRLLGE